MSLNDHVTIPAHSGRWASRPKASVQPTYQENNQMSKTL